MIQSKKHEVQMMNQREKIRVTVLPALELPLVEQRETGLAHTSFQKEVDLYHAIQKGQVEQVKKKMQEYLAGGLVVGRLSNHPVRQLHYWAIACISLAVHYAILGGLDETDGFNYSDEFIRSIDHMVRFEDCIGYLQTKAVELTEAVHRKQLHSGSSKVIRHCIHYIHLHLHEKLTISILSQEVGISRDYLSRLFKEEVGKSLHQYIIENKVKNSLIELEDGESYGMISYKYGFCSESHYIHCFKKIVGITPGQYRKKSVEFHQLDATKMQL